MGGQYYNSRFGDGYPVKWNVTRRLLDIREEKMNQRFQVENDFRATLESLRVVTILEYPYAVCLESVLGHYTGKLTLADAVNQAQALYLAEDRR